MITALLLKPLAAAALTAGLDCWAPTVAGMAPFSTPAESAAAVAFQRRLDAVEALLRRDARINAIADTRFRVHRFVGQPASEGAPLMADASVWLHRRRETWGPQCTLLRASDYTHHAELTVHLNSLDVFYQLLESPQEVVDYGTFPLPQIAYTVEGVPVYGSPDGANRVLVLTPNGIAPFLPVPGDMYRYRVNPAVFAGSRPGDVRIIMLSVMVSDEQDPQREDMDRWLREISLAPYRALLAPAGAASGTAVPRATPAPSANASARTPRPAGGPSADLALTPSIDGLPNLLTRSAGASVVAFSSEFGSGWVADNLIPSDEQLTPDGKPIQDLVWSSAANAPFPHWITLDLGRARWLTTLVFNNALTEEADHPGISARLLEVHVGASPEALRRVASFELQKNTNDQSVQIAPVEARFVKLVVRSNWGHPWYTELGASMAFDDGTRPGTLAAALRNGRADVYGIYFDFASAALRAESEAALTEIVTWHRANTAEALVIEGHTDAIGGDAANQVLSQQRAEAVVRELVRRGVPASLLTARGQGSRQPVADNATEAGRARNRRVTVVVQP